MAGVGGQGATTTTAASASSHNAGEVSSTQLAPSTGNIRTDQLQHLLSVVPSLQAQVNEQAGWIQRLEALVVQLSTRVTELEEGQVQQPQRGKSTRQPRSTVTASHLKKKESGSTSQLFPRAASLPHISVQAVTAAAEKQERIRSIAFDDTEESSRCAVHKFNGVETKTFVPASLRGQGPETKAPDSTLQLRSALGYQGKRCRDNVHCTIGNEVIFNTSSLVVLHDLATQQQRFYAEHLQEVKCVELHPVEPLVASGQVGGRTDVSCAQIRVWNHTTLQTVAVLGRGCLGNNVYALAFGTREPDWIASIHESRKQTWLTIWNWQTSNSLVQHKIGDVTIFALKFDPVKPTLVTGGKGHCTFWTIGTRQDAMTLTPKSALFHPHPQPRAVLCIAFSPATGRTMTGDSTGNICVWSLPVPTYQAERCIAAHTDPAGVFSLQTTSYGFVSGGKDGVIKVWSWEFQLFPLSGEGDVNTIQLGESIRCIACVQTELGPSLSQLVVGTQTNMLQFVDAGTAAVERIINGNGGDFLCMAAHPTEPNIVCVSSTTSHITFLDIDTQDVLFQTLIHEDDGLPVAIAVSIKGEVAVGTESGIVIVLDSISFGGKAKARLLVDAEHGVGHVSFSPSGDMLACGTKNGNVHLYNITTHDELASISCGKQPHSSDWSETGQILRINTTNRLLYIDTVEKQTIKISELDDNVSFVSSTCPMSYETQGVWDHSGVVTAVCRSPTEPLLAAANDQGQISLYRYPCLSGKAEARMQMLHTGGVASLVFSCDGRVLLSAGDADNTLMVWTVSSVQSVL
eukprot:m.277472 g.277472  ORF g.277472 m.277472 type:complete len:800 (+) comp15728_c1_seq5:113-2512(+)